MRLILHKFLLITILIFLAANLNAQDHFGILKSPETGQENVLKIDANDNMYMGIWGYGLQRSNDNGATWTNITNGLPNTYITDINFNTDGIIFVTTFGNGVYRSLDYGASWVEANNGITNLNTTTVAVLDDQRVFVGTYGSGTFYSNDSGESWIESNSGMKFRDVRTIAEFTKNNFIVAGTYGGSTYMTRDSGKTWKWEKTGATNYYINDFTMNSQDELFAASNGRGLLYSVNSGISYDEYDSLMRAEFSMGEERLTDYNFTCVVLNIMGEPVVGTRNHGIFKFDRFTWNHWMQTAKRAEGITDMAVNSAGIIFATTMKDELFKSEDGGESWVKLGNPIGDKNAYVHPYKNGKIYMAINSKLYESNDYGYNWAQLSFMPGTGEIMAFDSAGVIYLGLGNGLYRSIDNGASFIPSGYTDTSITNIAVSSNNEVYVSWTFATETDPPNEYQGIDAFVSGVKQKVTDLTDPVSVMAADKNGGVTYIDNKGGLRRTTDLGTTWLDFHDYSGSAKSIYFDHDNNVYIITENGLNVSTNFGSSWDLITIDVEANENERFDKVFVTPDDRLYAVVKSARGVFYYQEVYYTDDLGETWIRTDQSFTQNGNFDIKPNYQGDVYVYSNMLYKAFNPNTIKRPTVISPAEGEFVNDLTPVITWEPAFKAEMYEIQISNTPGFSFIWDYVVQSDTTFKIFDSLNNNVTYYYRIRSKTHDAYSNWRVGSFKTTLQAPILEYPANDSLCVSQIAELSWFEINGAEKYVVHLSDSMNFNNMIVEDTVETLSYITPQLNGYSEYYWRIKAISEDTESAWSEIWKFRTLVEPANLTYPEDNTINYAVGDTFKFIIDYPIDYYNYAFVEIIDGDDNVIDSNSVSTDSTYISEMLTYNTTYTWRVGVVTDCDEVVYSEEFSFTTELEPVVLVSPENEATNLPQNISLDWEDHTSLPLYQLMVATDNSFTNIIEDVSDITESGYDLTALQNNTVYYWKVKAYDATLNSAWSETWTFTTVLTKPQLRSPADSSINVSVNPAMLWFSVEGADFYQLQVARDHEFDDLIFSQDSIMDVTRDIEGLEVNTRYFWRVRAMSETGTTDWSDTWTFVTQDLVPVLVYPENEATEVVLEETFRWGSVTGADHYQLQIAKDTEFGDMELSDDNISENSLNVTLHQNNQTYYWRVRAFIDGSYSDWSEVWSFTTKDGMSVYEVISSELEIYPNPSSAFINVNLEFIKPAYANIYIADLSGNKLEYLSYNKYLSGNKLFRWDVTSYPQGTYFLIIESNGSIINKKLKVVK